MELTVYVLMAFGAYVALISRRRGVLYGWFLLYVGYSVIVRIMPPTVDMVVYSEAMAAWPPPFTFYTLREPVVWIGVPFLHYLLNNRIATFLIVDVLTGLIVYRAMHDLDDGDGRMFAMAPAIMTSYVFLLGQQNVWRQHVAFIGRRIPRPKPAGVDLLVHAVVSRAQRDRPVLSDIGSTQVARTAFATDLCYLRRRRYAIRASFTP